MKNNFEKIEESLNKNSIKIIICLIITGIIIRLYFLPFNVPITGDGFYSFVYASKIMFDGELPNGYTTTNTGWAYLLSAIFSITDRTDPFQLMTIQKVSAIIISSLTVVPVYFLLKKFVSIKLALFGCLIFTLEPRLLLISLEGLDYTLFVFIFVTAIALFLKRTNISFIVSFVCIALTSLVRYEGILLIIPFSVMFLIFNKKKKDYLKLIGLISLTVLILIPVLMIRVDVTSEICYNSIFGEICGRDGIFDNHVMRVESVSDKILGVADLDDPIYNENKPMFDHFLFLSFSGLFRFLAIICIPYFFIFIGLSFLRFRKKDFKLRTEHVFIIFVTCIALLPAIYAYGRGIQDYRYVMVVIPLLTIFSVKITESIPKIEKNKIIFLILIILIIVLSIAFIENYKPNYELREEAFYVSKKINQLTDVVNVYQYNGYIKTAKLIEEWPELPKAVPTTGKLESSTKISTAGYNTINDFLEDEKNQELEYIVVDNTNEFFNDLRENPSNYDYLKLIFDSRDLDFKNEYRIYKINDEK